MNAFTIPKTSTVSIREKTAKQIKQDAQRVNRLDPSCMKNDMHKTQRISRTAI